MTCFRPHVLLMDSDYWGPSHGIRFYSTGQDIYNDKELARQGIRVLSARELTDEEFEEYRMGRTTAAALAEKKVTQ